MIEMHKFGILAIMAFIGGCASQVDPAALKRHQLEVQRMQTRIFDTNDRKELVRGVIGAMQDLNFIINNADVQQGIVTAKKFGPYPIDMTVTIQPVSNRQMLVHGIAQYKLKTIEDPALYGQFFSSLQDFLPDDRTAGSQAPHD